MTVLPEPGYLKRMQVYFAEMFPIPSRLAAAVGLYGSFSAFLGVVHHVQVSFLSLHAVIGSWSFFTMMLITRLMDELKDREIDRRLFKDRPLPSGRVLESDISLSLAAAVVLYVIPNLFLGTALWMALAVLGYSVLMFKFFFLPRLIKKSLLLALATHSPLIPLLFAYVLVLFAEEHELGLRELNWRAGLIMIAVYWMIFVAWEIARKIRSTKEEDDYVTYSRIFGQRRAAVLVAGSQTVALVIAVYFWVQFSLSGLFLAIWLGGYVVAAWGLARFIRAPSPSTSKLWPFAERFIVAVAIANLVEYGVFAAMTTR